MSSQSGRQLTFLIVLSLALTAATGCAAVEGIFKAGLWVGVIIAALIIGVVYAVASRFRTRP